MSNTEYEDKKFHYPIMWSELNESGHVKFDQEMEEKYGVSLYEVEKKPHDIVLTICFRLNDEGSIVLEKPAWKTSESTEKECDNAVLEVDLTWEDVQKSLIEYFQQTMNEEFGKSDFDWEHCKMPSLATYHLPKLTNENLTDSPLKMPDGMRWAIVDSYEDTPPAVVFYCDNDEKEKEETSSYFLKLLFDEGDEEEENYDVKEGQKSKIVRMTDYGFTVDLVDGVSAFDVAFSESNSEAIRIEDVLSQFHEKFPDIGFEVYAVIDWSDSTAGEVYDWYFSSEDLRTDESSDGEESLEVDETDEEDEDYEEVVFVPNRSLGEFLNRVLLEDHIWESYNPSLDLDDLVFAVTGKLNRYSNRSEITVFIEENGGKVTDGVSSKTNYLINNDFNSSSSKNIAAKKLGIPIISEIEFMNRFDSESCELAYMFWTNLANEPYAKDYMRFFYAHKEWISENNLRRAVSSLIDLETQFEEHEDRADLIEYANNLFGGKVFK